MFSYSYVIYMYIIFSYICMMCVYIFPKKSYSFLALLYFLGFFFFLSFFIKLFTCKKKKFFLFFNFSCLSFVRVYIVPIVLITI